MVEGYVGRPGAGKTATAVARLWKAKTMGKPVYANIPLIDRRTRTKKYGFFGRTALTAVSPEGYGKSWADGLCTNLKEILALDNAIVLLDEVHMWLGSDAWKEIGFETRQYLAQQRKIGIDIWWTAQANGRVFNVIRELTACLWLCQRYGRLSYQLGADPETKESMGKRWAWVGPSVWQLYDTEFMVGDAKGETAGSYGKNRNYDRFKVLPENVVQPRQLTRYWETFPTVARYRWSDEPDPREIPSERPAAKLKRPGGTRAQPVFKVGSRFSPENCRIAEEFAARSASLMAEPST